jgi:AraC family transcriptional regulator
VFTLPRDFTTGEPRRWRRVPGLILAEIDYGPGMRISESHDHARLVLVLGGNLTSSLDGSSSTLWFWAPGAPQRCRASASGARCLIVDIEAAWLARVGRDGTTLDRSMSFRPGFVTHLAHRLYSEFTCRDEVARIAIESLTLGVVVEAARHARRAEAAPPAWLERARAFIDDHFAETLTLAMVAALAGVHPVHLARTFRRAYDMTFAGYVRTVRLDYARRQLAATDAPLGEIAAAAGFYDQSHFCRLFKQSTGLSPAAYRLSARSR